MLANVSRLEQWIKHNPDMLDLVVGNGLKVRNPRTDDQAWTICQHLVNGPSESFQHSVMGRVKRHSRFILRFDASATAEGFQLQLAILFEVDGVGVEERIVVPVGADGRLSVAAFENTARSWNIAEDGVQNGTTVILKIQRAVEQVPSSVAIVWQSPPTGVIQERGAQAASRPHI